MHFLPELDDNSKNAAAIKNAGAGDIPKDVRNTMPMEPQSTNPPTYPVSSFFFMDSIQMKTASPHRRGEHLPQMGDSLLPENYAINRLECSPLARAYGISGLSIRRLGALSAEVVTVNCAG
ncbi:hypothetical protein KR52_05720 [Synechococcus sp. KORDI-52]|nr:hypothetical protein KR52_05720 [Synechococcus sp. KORDI-52]